MARKIVKAPAVRPERQLLCFLDVIETSRLEGWAVDFERPTESLKLRVMIDDAIEDVMACDGHRDDARLVNQANSRIGFTYDIPERYWDGVRHRIRFVTLDGAGGWSFNTPGMYRGRVSAGGAKTVAIYGDED